MTTPDQLSSAASISAELEVVAVAGVSIGVIAGELEEVEAQVEGIRFSMEQAVLGIRPHPFQEMEAVAQARDGCRIASRQVRTLGEDARAAAENYAQTERGNARLMELQQAHSAWSLGMQLRLAGCLAPLVAWGQAEAFMKSVRREGLRKAGMGALGHAPGYLSAWLGPDMGLAALVAGWTGAARPAHTTGAMTVGLRRLMEGMGLLTPGDLRVRRVPPAEWRPAHPDGPSGPAGPSTAGLRMDAEGSWAEGSMAPTVHAVLASSADAYTVAPPSSIIVKQVDRGDGATVWIVNLPGTEDWGLDTGNLWDVEGDLEAMTAAQRGEFAQKSVLVQELVKAALADAGAAAGDEVLLTGHSGGGIHAAMMAADPAFVAEVNVKMIVIAGSPGAQRQLQPGITAVDLVNVHDIVTGLSGAEPAQTDSWMTVVSEPRPGADPANLGALALQAHQLDGYLGDAEAFDNSADPAYAAAKERLAALLGAGAAAAGAAAAGSVAFKQSIYQGTDVPKPPAPKPPPKPLTPPSRRDWGSGR
ncbi:hypothetical protein [Arthrobacter sp. 35W]|uniref:hypothetical protein n=1 Tax=Arthrobacter sp. 35W TaxID=1132441 RepID=UPI000403B0AD|nr:hypothetical protein [Arthrobacter sp. 35W]